MHSLKDLKNPPEADKFIRVFFGVAVFLAILGGTGYWFAYTICMGMVKSEIEAVEQMKAAPRTKEDPARQSQQAPSN
ncbi:MAG: hypothetical protein K2X77_21665 [Candidatus Obscuribacterales bacterium]|nr:hypothetical protein [Candidatus Obscuribacterales bacterium]